MFWGGERIHQDRLKETTTVIQVKGDGGLAQGGGNENSVEWSFSEYILGMLKVKPKA